MNKDVSVIVTGTQFSIDGKDGDEIKTLAQGNYYKKNNKHYVLYEEIVDNINTKTTLKFNESELSMNKTGAMNTSMVFEKGKKYISVINTPYGSMLLGVNTKKIDLVEEENKIELKVEYAMELNDEFVANCILSACISG